MNDWATTERKVRQIAEANWSAPCRPREIAGVRYDAVIEHRPDYFIVIEITNEANLGKLRDDIAKLSQIRFSNFSKSIFTECYFVTRDDASSLKESGSAQHVSVMSVQDFSELFIGSREYIHERSETQFGSAVDPDSGKKDETPYTKIEYEGQDGSRFSIEKIAEKIMSGERIILLGEFGTGKSRCIQELFQHILSEKNAALIPPLAINLRDNWGLQSFDLIVRHHMNSLGLSKFGDNAVKLASRGKYILLLDGFDEIGAQSWTGEANRLSEIRRSSLSGIRDLIGKSRDTGFLIAGREHYFSSDKEMIDCLGMFSEITILRCPEEFSDEEVSDYLSNTSNLIDVPPWMPRKPLICQLVSRIDSGEMIRIMESSDGEVEFFEKILDAICERETGIKRSVIDQLTLKRVLLTLAQFSREKAESIESISPEEINSIFYMVSGRTPLDESSIILQRLPYLGRVGSGSADRTFIDDYAKNGLRGLSLSGHFNSFDRSISARKWVQPLSEWGCRVLGSNDKLPELFDDKCRFEHFNEISNVSRISELSHSNAHKTLIAIIQKLFFQPGGGRKEDALLRGTSRYWDQVAADQIIAYMLANGIVTIAKGREGRLYVPKRKYAKRMARIAEMQSSCTDDIWGMLS